MRRAHLLLLFSVALVASAGAAAWYFLRPRVDMSLRFERLRAYRDDPVAHADWQITVGERCPGAPFILPTTGLVGFGYGDSWSRGQSHQGFDIFGPTALGETPVVAAYDGYLTRLPEWKSTVIIRVPEDPLRPSRQIWTYYTHLADPQGRPYISLAFPPGTSDKFVRAGTLLGHQGNYSGDSDNPTGMHLHFSIVKDDGSGRFLNELRIENTLDPSPYLGLAASVNDDWTEPIRCASAATQ